jgi:hypothetical protein
MKSIILAAAALLIGATVVQAQVVWQGEAIIDSASSACDSDADVGPLPKVIRSVLRPKNVDVNGENTNVVFLANQLALFMLILDHGAMPKGTGVAFGNDYSGVIKANVGIKYSNFQQKPATPDATTEEISLQGDIKDFLYIKNCDVSFRAAYTRRP